ncbi:MULTISPECIES: glycosyl hydrolase [unclassified Clostridium]|uniref:glycosyl hydrolase n=1 Tax=unclassified Clostridium TaxID=2614128 RepID=UPI0002977F46|nr:MULTISPECIES: glycosyl hydrolase [unclassified Clostridium]EKQ56486.1 MAG: beta-mannanase [Clostridium sp. Maddingley MBC34-26]
MSNLIVIDSTDIKHINGRINREIEGYSNSGYLTALTGDDDYVIAEVNITNDGIYKVGVRYALPLKDKSAPSELVDDSEASKQTFHRIFINNECYGSIDFNVSDVFTIKELGCLKLKNGINIIKLLKQSGFLNIDSINVTEEENYIENKPNFALSNNNASKECVDLMRLFSKIYGNGILSGQHCNKASGTDFEYTERMTGKTPAILGFDLLSYSLSTETPDSNFECIDELANNRGSIETALIWGKDTDAIITLCWHWFSPMHGRGKSFYTENTNFNLEKALIEGTEENISMLRDLDIIAEQLKKFRDNNIPVLWRPLHEASGGWFWWGAKGPQAYIRLYRLMYDRYVNYHELNNLIWVWNSPDPEWYPGDDVVDINSKDYYAPLENHGPLTIEFLKTAAIPKEAKPVALSENGPIPDPKILKETGTPWLWFMTWNNFVKELEWNTKEELMQFYNDEYVINLEDLAQLKASL